MEGVLDIWEGLMSGWRSHFVTLFSESLIISEFKGGPVKFKVPVSDLRIDSKSERETKFSLTSGNSTWEVNAKDIRDKIKWISALKATQRVCHENSDRLDQAVKLNSLHQNPDGANSEREIESLMQNTTIGSTLRDKLSKVWLLQSEFTEALATMSLKIPPAHRADEEFNNMVNVGNDLKREIAMIVKDIEFESKKLADLDKIIRDKSMRLSTGGAFSARDFPIGPTDHTINHGSLQPEPRIFENSRAPDLRLPRMIDDEFDSAQVNIKYPENQYKQISGMQPDAIRQGSARKTSMGGNQSKHQLDRQFIEERDEEHFESAKGSIRGDSNFQSVIEYDNSQYAMDGRFNPLMLKKKPTSEYYQEQSGKVYAKAPSPNQFGNQSRLAMSGGQQSPYNQIRDAPQTRIPSNRLIHISAPYQPQPNLGMNQSVQSGSQFSVNPSYYKGPAQGSSPQNMIQAQKVSSPTNLKMHPFIEDLINNNKVFQLYPVNTNEPLRTQLPHLIDPKKKIDIIKLIKDLIGKDITKIALPAYMNEPISMLQRLTEPLEYKDLLDKAATIDDGALRLAYAMGMLFITYSNTPLRMKKPFNPLQGETFDEKLGDLDVVCEQVSHHPPISACFAKCKGYELYACTNVESSIGMKSFQINPKGGLHVYFSKYKDHVWVKQCKTYVYNLIFGTMDVQHYGEMQGKNFTTGDTISFNLNDQGWTVKRPSEGTGKIVDKNGNLRYTLKGDWKIDPYFHAIKPNGEIIEIVKRKANPPNFEANYRFSYYTINMNYISKDMIPEMCPTDCRMRPDNRALEHGNEDLAESEKKRLEQKQRDKRKERETKSQKWEPRWFRTEYDLDSNETVYRYRGGYWEAKARHQWGDIESLY